MRIGNLPRSGSPAGTHSGRLLRVLLLAATGAALLAVWQVMPVILKQDPARRTAAVSQPEPSAKRQQAAPAPAAAPLPAPAAAPPSAPAVTPPSTTAATPGPRVVYAGPLVTSGATPLPGRAGTGATAAADPAPGPATAPPAPEPLPAAPRTDAAAAPAPASSPRIASVAPSAADAPAPDASSTGRVDLNTASVEELNALPGAGLIGRAIVRGRPYASPEELLTKRVLNRATYERIKDQITAQ